MEEGRHTFGASDCKSIIPHHNRPSHNRTPWHATTTQDISWYDFRAVKASYFSDILRAILNSRSSSPLHDPPTLKVVLIGVDTHKMRTLVESFVRASEGEFIATRWVSSVWTRRHNNCLRAAPLAFASVVSRGAIRQDDLVLPPHPQAHIHHYVIEHVLCIRELQHRHLGLAFSVLLRTFVVLRTAPSRTTCLTQKTAAIPFRVSLFLPFHTASSLASNSLTPFFSTQSAPQMHAVRHILKRRRRLQPIQEEHIQKNAPAQSPSPCASSPPNAPELSCHTNVPTIRICTITPPFSDRTKPRREHNDI